MAAGGAPIGARPLSGSRRLAATATHTDRQTRGVTIHPHSGSLLLRTVLHLDSHLRPDCPVRRRDSTERFCRPQSGARQGSASRAFQAVLERSARPALVPRGRWSPGDTAGRPVAVPRGPWPLTNIYIRHAIVVCAAGPSLWDGAGGDGMAGRTERVGRRRW